MGLPEDHSHAPSPAAEGRLGVACALGAYLAWGFIPLYFKLVSHVPPIVVLSHRIIWSVMFVGALIAARRGWGDVLATLRAPRTLAALGFSTALIAVNWFVFLWAITHRQVLQAGLGYFINPLVSVLLGIVFLRERLRPGQAGALLMATAGVLVQVVALNQVPWVALTLAVSFAFYALVRKTAAVGPLVGLFVETTLLLPLAVAMVMRAEWAGAVAFSARTHAVLILSGVVTAVPLVLFAAAARRLRMATLGFMQFLSPTCQLLLAVLVFGEPFTRWHLTSFGLIWIALVLYSIDSVRGYRAAPAVDKPDEPARVREAVTCAEA